MNALESKLFDSLLKYWQTIINGMVNELEDAYPLSSGATASKIGTLNENPIAITSQGFKVTISMPDYYQFLDEGVKGAKSTYSKSSGSPFAYTDKMPPVDAILKFMDNRGISDWSDIKSKTKLRKKVKAAKKSGRLKRNNQRKNTRAARSAGLDSLRRSIAFVIARSIFNKGLEATNFYSNVINDPQLIKFEARLLDEFSDYVIDVVRVENK
jgi:hypothetical protein